MHAFRSLLAPLVVAAAMLAACADETVAPPRVCDDPQYRCAGIMLDTLWIDSTKFETRRVRCQEKVCDSGAICTVHTHVQ